MDTLTHTVIGACMGEAIAGKQLGKKAMWMGALANNFPDVDVISGLWENETHSLLVHRGITHSIICNLVMSFVFAWIFQKLYTKYEVSYKRWLILFGSGLFLHIILDAFTAYGTGWFEPFSHYRVTFNTIFILDPVFTLPVLVATIALMILRRQSQKRERWWKIGVGLSSVYLILIIINKLYVNRVVRSNIKEQNIVSEDFMATPTALNNFLWYIVVKGKKEQHVAYYSIFDKSKILSFETFQINDSLLGYPCEEASVKDLTQFSKGFYVVNVERDTIIFSDIRFGQLNGWTKKNSPFVFNFRLEKNCSNRKALQQGRFASANDDVLGQLWRRMMGN
jgi:inner membrane protein